jgi:hypothetical protein
MINSSKVKLNDPKARNFRIMLDGPKTSRATPVCIKYGAQSYQSLRSRGRCSP